MSGRDSGSFEVFGQAEGLGFAWRPQKWFYPQPKPASITYEPDPEDPPSRYEPGDKIELDLSFPRAAHVSGTIADGGGKPLAGVQLDMRVCESLTKRDNDGRGWTLDSLNAREIAPASMKLRTTDADGRFDFAGLPVNCVFEFDVWAKGYPGRRIYAATTDGPQPDRYGRPVLTGEIKLSLATPLDVPIKLVAADTGLPAAKARVGASLGLVGDSRTTNDLGRATLRLPPGRYQMEYLPARGTLYLVTNDELVVGPSAPAEPIVLKLKPAAVVEVTVVDAETGVGLADVDLWRQTANGGHRGELVCSRSYEVATRICWIDSPRTDARGILRTLMEPGKHRLTVGVESYPLGYSAVESGGQEVEAVAGETVRVKFTMKKREEPKP